MQSGLFFDPYELENSQELNLDSRNEVSVHGTVDLELPAPSCSPTLVFVKRNLEMDSAEAHLALPFHARYPGAIPKSQSQRCHRKNDEAWLGPYCCEELQMPVALVDYLDASELQLAILKHSQGPVQIEIPAGNTDHLNAVLVLSFFVLLASFGMTLWFLTSSSILLSPFKSD